MVLGDDCVEFLLGILAGGDSSWAMRYRTAIFLADLTGIAISVPSGLKNWSICSVMGLSLIRSDHLTLENPLVK